MSRDSSKLSQCLFNEWRVDRRQKKKVKRERKMSTECYNRQFKCLICYRGDNDDKVGDNCPLVEGKLRTQEEAGFSLVCRLLTANVMIQPGDTTRKLTELEQVVFGGESAPGSPPQRANCDGVNEKERATISICQSCTRILGEILRLEEQMGKLKTMQMAQSEIVKDLLLKTGQAECTVGVSSLFWENTRRQLFECLIRQEKESFPAGRGKTDSDCSTNNIFKRPNHKPAFDNLNQRKRSIRSLKGSKFVGKQENLVRPCAVTLTRLRTSKTRGESVLGSSTISPPERQANCNENEPCDVDVKEEVDATNEYDDTFDDAPPSPFHFSNEPTPSNHTKESHGRPVRRSKIRAVDFIKKALSSERKECPQVGNKSKKRKLTMDTEENKDCDDHSDDREYSPPHSDIAEPGVLEQMMEIQESKNRKTNKKLNKSLTNDIAASPSEDNVNAKHPDGPQVKKIRESNEKGRKGGSFYKVSRFLYVTNSTVLFRQTILSVEDNGTTIRCQEPGCPVSFVVDPMNFVHLFHQAKSHVNDCHSKYTKKCSKMLLRCPVCNEDLQGKTKFRRHIILIHGGIKPDRKDKRINSSYGICEVCMKPVYKMDSKLAKHSWTHLNYQEKMVEAVKINGGKKPETPVELDALVDERNKVLDMKAMSCQDCGRIFSSRRRLQAHLPVHAVNRRTWICEECGKYFLSRVAVRNHVERIHLPVAERKHLVCPEPGCGKLFYVRDTTKFQDHLKKHRGETLTCMCDLCGKECQSKKDLDRHQNENHFNVDKFECEQCGKKYSCKNHLKRHKKLKQHNS